MTHENAEDVKQISTKQTRAAQLWAEDELTDGAIAQAIGVNRSTLSRWKRRPAIQARILAISEQIAGSLIELGIADRQNRIGAYRDRWQRCMTIIEERAATEPPSEGAPGDVAGWSTGLMVHTVKGVGKGDNWHLEHLYAVDAALLAELRAIEKQAAQDLGQWLDKAEFAGANDPPAIVTIIRDVPDLGFGRSLTRE